MQRKLAVLGPIAALGILIPSTAASADPVEHPNCHGAIVSFVAQYGGLKQAADAAGVTVKEGQSYTRALCALVNGTP